MGQYDSYSATTSRKMSEVTKEKRYQSRKWHNTMERQRSIKKKKKIKEILPKLNMAKLMCDRK